MKSKSIGSELSRELQSFYLKGVGRKTDDGKVFGSKVAKHPLPPRWHQEGEDDDGL